MANPRGAGIAALKIRDRSFRCPNFFVNRRARRTSASWRANVSTRLIATSDEAPPSPSSRDERPCLTPGVRERQSDFEPKSRTTTICESGSFSLLTIHDGLTGCDPTQLAEAQAGQRGLRGVSRGQGDSPRTQGDHSILTYIPVH